MSTKVSVTSKKTLAPVKVTTSSTSSARTTPVIRKAKVSKAAKKAAAKEAAKVTPVVEVAPVETVETVETVESVESEEVVAKPTRTRPRQRSHDEMYAQIGEELNTAYKCLQSAVRTYKSLGKAHIREVSHTKTRTTATRTPTLCADKALTAYFRDNLSAADLEVHRKDGLDEVNVDLSDLSTDTRIHRTDVTQLYNKVFIKNNLRNPDDLRQILYEKDPTLVSLLTVGDYKETLEEDVQKIRDGTYRLTIFNIQRFTSHHLHKGPLPTKQ